MKEILRFKRKICKVIASKLLRLSTNVGVFQFRNEARCCSKYIEKAEHAGLVLEMVIYIIHANVRILL